MKKIVREIRHSFFDFYISNNEKRKSVVERLKADGIYQKVQESLKGNSSSFNNHKNNILAQDIYLSLFDIILSTKTPELELENILSLIHEKDVDVFDFLILNILTKNPRSLKDTTIKQLILSITTKLK